MPKRERKRIKPRVLNLRRDGCPKGAVYCGRGSAWGSPYVIGRDGTREQVIKKYAKHILPNLRLTGLRGKDLVCFCAPLPCHCDLLIEVANA